MTGNQSTPILQIRHSKVRKLQALAQGPQPANAEGGSEVQPSNSGARAGTHSLPWPSPVYQIDPWLAIHPR